MRDDILAVLRSRPVVADGAMGTQLTARGLSPESCLELANLDRPDLVETVHADYLGAGAQVLETNTFGANAAKLDRFGLASRTAEINRQGALLARRAAAGAAWVAGSMGPLGRAFVGLAPRPGEERPDPERMGACFAEQAAALAEGGVDLIILETFPDLEQLCVALAAVKAATGLPVAAQMVFGTQGRTLDGRSARECFETLTGLGADVVGLNCGVGPRDALAVIEGAAGFDGLISVFPNAGYPERVDDRLVYPSSPDYFAATLAACAQAGARLLGGCCGAGPEHIAALSRLMGASRVSVGAQASPPPVRTSAPTGSVPAQPGRFLKDAGQPGARPKFLVELDPPKHLDISGVLEGASALAEAGADAVTLAENPLAVPRLSNVALAHLVATRCGVETVVHLTGRDRNLIGLQSTLMGLACLGLTNVLAVTGDPPTAGGGEKLTGVFDARSFELIAMLEGFRQGRNAFGEDMRAATDFHIGAAFNPNTADIRMQVRRMEKKIAAGARYFLTQPVYSRQKADLVLEATKHIDVPIFLGVMPLASLRNALFLHNEFPGISIPAEVLARMEHAGDKGQDEGLEIAWELMEYAVPHFAGIYCIPPFNRHAVAVELIRRARSL
ncbi:bifunctional homocysteine S-methyltransferase/methylenetetrahydrofolate reductase [Fundidesulfovibrio butyratiphilus]